MENLQPPFNSPDTWIGILVGLIILFFVLGIVVRSARCLMRLMVVGIAAAIAIIVLLMWGF